MTTGTLSKAAKKRIAAYFEDEIEYCNTQIRKKSLTIDQRENWIKVRDALKRKLKKFEKTVEMPK